MLALLFSLALIFAQLSLLAFGGGSTVLPEMQRQVVFIHHWMSAQDFKTLYALSQAAPGPNMMIATLIGWHVAGGLGALVSSLAKFGPSSILTGIVFYHWRNINSRVRVIIQTGLAPITVGLIAASAALITKSSDQTWGLIAVTAISAMIMLKNRRLHPLWLLAGGALFGLLSSLF